VLPKSDPLIYRFYEIMQVYGLRSKRCDFQEKFGDGIMSANRFNPSCGKKSKTPRLLRVQVQPCVAKFPALQEVVIAAR